MNMYEDASKMTKEAMDNALRSMSAVTKGFQQIAAETSEFSKRSCEQQTAMIEQLMQTRTLDKSLELQSEYARTAYQNWVGQTTRMGELYADIAKEAYRPFERVVMEADGVASRAAQKTQKAAEAAEKKAA